MRRIFQRSDCDIPLDICISAALNIWEANDYIKTYGDDKFLCIHYYVICCHMFTDKTIYKVAVTFSFNPVFELVGGVSIGVH